MSADAPSIPQAALVVECVLASSIPDEMPVRDSGAVTRLAESSLRAYNTQYQSAPADGTVTSKSLLGTSSSLGLGEGLPAGRFPLWQSVETTEPYAQEIRISSVANIETLIYQRTISFRAISTL